MAGRTSLFFAFEVVVMWCRAVSETPKYDSLFSPALLDRKASHGASCGHFFTCYRLFGCMMNVVQIVQG
jgi:hypothetical protein